MPENSVETPEEAEATLAARFDHVGEDGRLVFAADDLLFAVAVDDTLERAILAAKQVDRERAEMMRRPPAPTLPISSIQSLIRAGATPSAVAERYGLDEALVRRFSAAVVTEKQYAIEQFLAVPAPKESRVRAISDLIDRTLAAAGVPRASLVWSATRRGHEPWRIIAQFESAGRAIRAEWTWNMHDNSVASLNGTARKLLGEQPLGVRGSAGAAAPVPSVIQPGSFGEGFAIPLASAGAQGDALDAVLPASDGVRMAAAKTAPATPATASPTHSTTITATSGPAVEAVPAESSAASASGSQAPAATESTPSAPVSSSADHSPASASSTVNAASAHNPGYPELEQLDIYDMEGVGEDPNPTDELARVADVVEVPAKSGVAESAPVMSPVTQTEQPAAALEHADPQAPTIALPVQVKDEAAKAQPTHSTRPRRRTGRSAVPSWDEILFGE